LSSLKAKADLSQAICNIFAVNGKAEDVDYVMDKYNELSFGDAKFEASQALTYYAIQLTNTEKVKKIVDGLAAFRDNIPAAYKDNLAPYVNNVLLRSIASQKTAMKNLSSESAALQQQIDYINGKIK